MPSQVYIVNTFQLHQKIQSYDRKQKMAAPIVFFVKVYELVSRWQRSKPLAELSLSLL